MLHEHILDPLGASDTWSWHGYHNSTTTIDDTIPVVSGGAHWGGGLWISANDLALLGQLYLRDGNHDGGQLLKCDLDQPHLAPLPPEPRLRLPLVAQPPATALSGRPTNWPVRPR